mmetsp:Transcript_103243/g.313259  ORF Transcript_103243/g.313259 Transcript_103243/m.313259 type:complete len:268 (-) Transcript_103243:14-817(-)
MWATLSWRCATMSGSASAAGRRSWRIPSRRTGSSTASPPALDTTHGAWRTPSAPSQTWSRPRRSTTHSKPPSRRCRRTGPACRASAVGCTTTPAATSSAWPGSSWRASWPTATAATRRPSRCSARPDASKAARRRAAWSTTSPGPSCSPRATPSERCCWSRAAWRRPSRPTARTLAWRLACRGLTSTRTTSGPCTASARSSSGKAGRTLSSSGAWHWPRHARTCASLPAASAGARPVAAGPPSHRPAGSEANGRGGGNGPSAPSLAC